MGIRSIKKAGQNASDICDIVNDIHKINNKLGSKYDVLIEKVNEFMTGNNNTLADITDSKINNGLLSGKGTPKDIQELKTVLVSFERIILCVRAEVDALPVVDD